MLGWITKTGKAARSQAAQDAAKRQAEDIAIINLHTQVEKRFRGFVYMVPIEAHDLEWTADDRETLSENNWKMWGEIINNFPEPPVTQKEALRNEQRFWKRWALFCSKKNADGEREILIHATIFQGFKAYEKWIFREYFAATGKVIDPSQKEIVRIRLEQARISKPRGEFKYEAQARSRNEVQQLENELDHYIRVGREAHYEKWGNWFVTHVEEAFEREYGTAQQKPRSPKLGDGGFATLDEIESGEPSQNQSTPRAQSQTFKD